MNDPHVSSIRYLVKISENTRIINQTMEIERLEFTAQLKGKNLIIYFKMHYDTLKKAKKVADNFVTGWEKYIGQQYEHNLISFIYEGCVVIDRKPSIYLVPISVKARESVDVLGSVNSERKWVVLPEPPEHFPVSSDGNIGSRQNPA